MIRFAGGKTIKYTYSADGRKLRAAYTTVTPVTSKTVDYCGNLVFEDGQLKQMLVDGGYVPMGDLSGAYCFYVKDHLGNNRMVVHQSGTIEQVNNYYPYGGLMANTTGWNAQRFKYNGKEFDRMHGLDWYDYGARWMDASIGRWHSMDPLCEKFYDISPYLYCKGDPINKFDPDGREVKPDGNSLDVIKNTLSQEEQDYVRLNDDGLIDATFLSQCSSESNNFTALKTLVNSEIRVNVTMQSEMNYISNGVVMKESFPQVEVCNDFKDISFLSCIGNTQGETGNLGVTYMPTNGGSGKGPMDGSSIDININPTLNPIGAAETFSHEGYGHAKIYVLTNGNRNAAKHHYVGQSETNSTLIDYSIRARKETIKNMTR